MSLFKELERLVNNQDLTLHISKSEEKLIVTILPKPKVNDEAKTKLVPITLKGSAEELDKEIIIKQHKVDIWANSSKNGKLI